MIEFPNLWGLKFEIDRVAIQVFGIPIYWYGIIIAAGFMSAILLAMKDCKNYGLDQDIILDLVLYTVPAAIIGARLYYVAFSWNEFKDDFWSILNTRRGGLAIYGGVLAALGTAYLFARWKKIDVSRLFDFGVVYIPLGQAIGRWGNFINQEAFGTNTALPWGMTGDEIRKQLAIMQMKGMNVNPDLPVHPTFLYESLWNLGVFLILLWRRKNKKVDWEVLFLYMILYGAGRFWIEGLRTDSLMFGSFRVSQMLSFILAAVFAVLLFYRRKKASEKVYESVAGQPSEYANILKAIKEGEISDIKGDENSIGNEGNASEAAGIENTMNRPANQVCDENLPDRNNDFASDNK